MMRKNLSAALAAVVLAGTAYTVHQANAGQSYTGENGMPLNPTANGIPAGTIEGQATYFDFGEEDGSKFGFNGKKGGPIISPPPVFFDSNKVNAKLLPTTSPLERYKFNYYGILGAGRVTDHIEVSGGISRLRVSGDGEFNGLSKTGINAGVKYLVNPDASVEDIRYALGIGYDRALLKNWRAYGVASKGFNVKEGRAPIIGHLGVRWDRFDLDDVDGPKSSKFSVFTGVELPITRSGNFALTGELQSKNNEFEDAKMPFSVGLRYAPTGGGFSANVGIQRQGLIGDEGFYAQVGYAFR